MIADRVSAISAALSPRALPTSEDQELHRNTWNYECGSWRVNMRVSVSGKTSHAGKQRYFLLACPRTYPPAYLHA